MTPRTAPPPGQDIAVIGIGCRFPQAEGPDAFWRKVADGVETVSFFTREQARAAGAPDRLVDDPRYVPAQAILPDADLFDAAFFGINPKEADLLDPQQRQLLECAWETFEHAGNPPGTGRLTDPVAVFVGGYRNAYYELAGAHADGDPHTLFQRDIGNEADYLATRLAYVLDLKGPAVSVQTACSSSLVAVHLAAQALRAGECAAALAGGVTVRAGEGPGYLAPEGSIYSPDGHCRSFDAEAQGTVIAEGVGLVLLKRLPDALADGDTVHAVIKGSAIGNDGSGRVGFTAPSTAGQAAIVRAALTAAGVHPDTVGYVEAHGSATPMGDRIEIDALTRAYREQDWSGGRRPIGSVKAMMGHAHAAAGIAGLIKTILALRNRTVPPALHFHRPHPRIDFDASPFRVPLTAEPWPPGPDGAPRRAAVSSFGLGGTGAHVILEEAPRPVPPVAPEHEGTEPRRWHPLTLSAPTATALRTVRERLAQHLGGPEAPGLAETAHTLHLGRRHFGHRAVAVADSLAGARAALTDDARCPTAQVPGVGTAGPGGAARTGSAPSVAFLLPGLGDQHVGMAERLYATEPVFRRELDRCARLLGDRPGKNLLAGLYPDRRPGAGPAPSPAAEAGTAAGGPEPDLLRMLGRDRRGTAGQADDDPGQLPDTRFAQPAVFAVEYALAKLWEHWGIRPDALIGYSIGEFTVACLAGVLDLEDALRLVAERARLIGRLPAGAMLAVPLPEADVAERLADAPELALAALNGPGLSVVGGPRPAVEDFAARLRETGIVSRPVRTSHAFHTPMMRPVAREFAAVVASCTLREPRLPYVSTVTGDWITADQARDPAHWARHLCEPVRFAEGAARLWEQAGRVLLEVGPGRTLGSLALQARPAGAASDVRVLASLPARHESEPEDRFLMTTLGGLWLAGAPVDWQAVHGHEQPVKVPLPVHPFERRRHWPTVAPASPTAARTAAGETSVRAAGSDDGAQTAAARPAAPNRREEPAGDRLDGWFRTPGWTALPPLAAAPEPPPAEPWLLLTDDCGIGRELAATLTRHQVPVTTVSCADGSGTPPDGADHVLDPADRAGWDRLLREAAAAGTLPRHIVHLWTVTPPAPDGTATDAQEIWRRGFVSLLHLAQALGEAGEGGAPVRVTVVSSGMQALQAGRDSSPDKAAVLGMCRVWPLENPAVDCRSVDITLPPPQQDARTGTWEAAGSAARRTLARRVLAECLAPAADSAPAVVLRGSRRSALTYLPVPLPAADSAHQTDAPPALRENGVYLITGGLGGMGLALAGRLARDVHARLVLVSRSGLPPRHTWESLLAASEGRDGTEPPGVPHTGTAAEPQGKPGQETVHRIRAVLALEEAGAEVLVVRADVTDAAQLTDAVAQARERFGRVDGAVHAAGVPGSGVIQLKDPAVAARVVAPKLTGARNLVEALRPLEPSFVALCSSTLGVTGAPGQADYCAANACLDALAAHEEENGTGTVVSLDWDGWTEIGMAVREAAAGPAPATSAAPVDAVSGGTAPTDAGATGTAATASAGSGAATAETAPGGAVDGTRPGRERIPSGHPLLGDRLPAAGGGCDVHEARYSAAGTWLVDEHRMLGHPVVPGTGHLELVRAAFERGTPAGTGQETAVELSDVTFHAPIVLGEKETRRVRTVLERDGEVSDGRPADAATFHILSATGPGGAWIRHSTGRVRRLPRPAAPPTRPLDALIARMSPLPPPGDTGPMGFGPRSRCLRRMWAGEGECLAELRLPDECTGDLERLALHPSLMDLAAAYPGIHLADAFRIPLAYGRLRMYAPLPAHLFSHHRFTGGGPAGSGENREAGAGAEQTWTSEITLLDPDGHTLAHVEGFVLKHAGVLADRLRSVLEGTAPDLTVHHGPGADEEEPHRAQAGPAAPVRAADPLGDHLARGIDPERGTEAFLRVLAGPRLPQVVISPRALPGTGGRQHPGAAQPPGNGQPSTAGTPAGGDGAGDAPPARHPRPALSTPYVAPRDGTEKRLAALMAELLGVEDVGVDDRFFDLGGHSLLALQLLARLRSDFGARLSMNTFFQSLTVADLARQLAAPDGAADDAGRDPDLAADGDGPTSGT
ncbi:SDR family NAD(P)-dependent oxidoreductase [Streptomyces albus]|uniref:type I polyketide synthase n=1 Tax=Streptomyces albus TaxID=1888 RepID=UPI0024AE436A|nr:type I polyketide synthase [Streptomyces albus]MDI6412563.1 SDR family NAD(P)-dependent oxidoreductase [Streptomyces albus]